MEGHVGVQNEAGDDVPRLGFIFGGCDEIKFRVFPQNFPEMADVHIFQHGLVVVLPSQGTFCLDLKDIVGSSCINNTNTMVDVVGQSGDHDVEILLLGVEILEGEGAMEALEIELDRIGGTSMREKAWEKLW